MWTPPVGFTVGELPTATKLTQQVSDNLLWLFNGGWVDVSVLTSASNVTLSTSETTVIGPSASYTFSGTQQVMVAWNAANLVATGGTLTVRLYEDAVLVGTCAAVSPSGTTAPASSCTIRTPAAGAHTYTIKAIMGAGAGTVTAGAGMSLRVAVKGV